VPPGGYHAGFGVPKNTSIRSVAKYRARRREAFYSPRATTRRFGDDAGGHGQAQQLAGGRSEPKRSRRATGLKRDNAPQRRSSRTTDQALSAPNGGVRTRKRSRPRAPRPPTSPRGPSKMLRPKWAACTRPDERVLAALGLLDGAPTRFENLPRCLLRRVLCAPALRRMPFDTSTMPGAIAPTTHLHVNTCWRTWRCCRIKTVEQLIPTAGRVGQLLGLDRIPGSPLSAAQAGRPEYRRRPEKMGRAAVQTVKGRAGTGRRLYVDGTFASTMAARPLCPKNALSLDSDCACGGPPTTGSTISGQPFFAVERTIDHGLLGCCAATLCRVCSRRFPASRLSELEAAAYRARFVIVFDAKGKPGVLQGDVQTHPHRLHHLPQVSQGRLGRSFELRDRKRRCPRRAVKLLLGRARDMDWRPEERALGRETRKADPPVGIQVSLISHGFRRSGAGGLYISCSVDVPGKLSFRYIDATLQFDLLNEYGT